MKRVLIYTFLALLCATAAKAQQQPQLGQYMFNQFALNPGYAGSRQVTEASIHWRSQWQFQFDGAPNTFVMAVHTPLRDNKMGAGLQILGDKIGPKRSFGTLGTYAYKVKFGRSTLAAGLRFGFFQYTYNVNEIDYKDPEPIWGNAATYQHTLPTADFGLFYNTRSFYAGLSLNQLLGGNVLSYTNSSTGSLTLSTVQPHAYLSLGKAFELNRSLILNPSLVLKMVQGAPGSMDVNINLLIDERVWVGTIVKTGYGLGFMAQVIINDNFKLGYARDRGMDFMGGFAAARSNEFLLLYSFDKKNSKAVSPKYL